LKANEKLQSFNYTSKVDLSSKGSRIDQTKFWDKQNSEESKESS